jgi:hypothetical protein
VYATGQPAKSRFGGGPVGKGFDQEAVAIVVLAPEFEGHRSPIPCVVQSKGIVAEGAPVFQRKDFAGNKTEK